MDTRRPTVVLDDRARYRLLYLYSLLLIAVGFLLERPADLWRGMEVILTSPSNLVTDYMKLGGLGTAFLNSGILTAFSVFLAQRSGATPNGGTLAAIFTVSGFSFFGKNIYNSIPITLGTRLYAKVERIEFKTVLIHALYATALSPLISEITFGMNLPPLTGVALAWLTGIVVGLVVPPLAKSFVNFHHGFNLYNVGFTAGIIGMFATGALRMFNQKVETVSIVSGSNNLVLSAILFTFFALVCGLGFYLNGNSFAGYGGILRHSGKAFMDFTELEGFGLALVNMGIMGAIATSYILAVGGQLNGPTIGGVLTVFGFSALGKHPKNTLPVLAGVWAACMLNIYGINSTGGLLAALFGTTLAPIAGFYGATAGFLAGFFHMAMVSNVGYLHGGMNLYNNGFSGGFIAAVMVPILDALKLAVERNRHIHDHAKEARKHTDR